MQGTILITGANGQIGTELTRALRQRYGQAQVLATDIRAAEGPATGLFEQLDILDEQRLEELIDDYQVKQIYHLAAILSARGEANPRQSWQINMDGWFNVLEAARRHQLRVFFPSSIAVFGPDAPREATPQATALHPTTVYGISKAAGENWGLYYFTKYGVDVRSLRYPGIIGPGAMPGGGTTDYAVEIYHAALGQGHYSCFLQDDACLPMLYMPDAIRATLQLMEAPAEQIRVRTSYNLAAMSFTPAEIAASIREHLPDFTIDYQPDFRQAIAASWPDSIDDQVARRDWGWQPDYDLEGMTADMLKQLQQRTASRDAIRY